MPDNDPQGVLTAAAAPIDIPGRLGRYQILQKLGQGGMGAVYLALDTKLDRRVALKVLPPGSVNDPEAVARFQREAKALAKLSHPGIVQAHDSETDGGRNFLVMEYVEGVSLHSLLASKGAVAPAVAADYVHQAAQALQHAHSQGLVHRDLKPSNLLLAKGGHVKLLDLGLARFLQDQIGDASLTREGVGMGTPDYAAPEQFRDAHHVDPRADIYALGCTLYHLVAGRVPFPGSSLSEKCRAHEGQEPTPLEQLCPEVPAGLALVAGRMMAKRPADRFQTAQEVVEALAPYVAASSPSFAGIRNTSSWAGSQLTLTDAGKGRRRVLPWALAGAGVAAVLVTAMFGILLAWPGLFRDRSKEGPVAGDTGKEKTLAREEPKPSEKEIPSAAADDPNVLTVSQDPKDGGKYQTIGAALEQARPGMTIRVLDAKTYPEVLSLTRASRHAAITLEALHRATLAPGKTLPGLAKVGLQVANVPGITVRGFRLQPGPDTGALILVYQKSSGVVLDDLEFLAHPNNIGITIESLTGDRTDTPVLVRNCVFRGLKIGIQVSGKSGAGLPVPCGRIIVQNNEFRGCRFGIWVKGAVHDLHVVGNRIEGSSNSGVILSDAFKEMRDILIANNTFFENFRGFQFFDDLRKTDRGERIALRNNLFLACNPDLVFLDSRGQEEIQGDGDGAALLKVWRIDHNAREAEPGKQSKGWIPAGTKDVTQAQLGGLSRKPDSPDYLRPDKDSPLATEGAGTEDPSLPRYVGARPPRDVEPGDWQRTWLMPRDARLLTVSKDPADKADYDTIGKALAVARPWTTIRVLDAATYTEAISLDNTDRHEGVCLEALQGATLAILPGMANAVRIRDVPHVRLAGFRLRDSGQGAPRGSGALPIVSVTGKTPGVVLHQLDFQLRGAAVCAVRFENLSLLPEDPPVVLSRCVVQGDKDKNQDGIVVLGNPVKGLTRSVCVRDNRISGVNRGILVWSSTGRGQVTGNLVWNCRQAGIQIEDLAPGAEHLLLANNTAVSCGAAFRVWESKSGLEHRKGQVEVTNNLWLDAHQADMGFYLEQPGGKVLPGDGEALLKLWSWHHNRRDGSGTEPGVVLPLAAGDRRVEMSELTSSDTRQPDKFRPRKDSGLATQGAGTQDLSLPAYIGALSPEGVESWDWSRTWNAPKAGRADVGRVE